MNEDSVFKPKKRIFMALTSISAVLGALMFYVVWKVTFPGLYEISRFLPIVFGFFGVLIVLAMQRRAGNRHGAVGNTGAQNFVFLGVEGD